MERPVRNVLIILMIIGLAYFLVFIPINLQGSQTEELRLATSLDENLQYGFLMRMYTPGATWGETISHLVDYLHYIYGYPFYVFSALAVLPVWAVTGGKVASYPQVTLLVLRQVISILPILGAAMIMVYLQTRFRSMWKSIILFVLILTIPGVFRQNILWWHPDALMVLFAALVFFFLDKDDYQYRRYFVATAVSCGLAAGTKLVGFFFFLTIPLYLYLGYRQHKISLKQVLLHGAIFVVIMLGVFVFTNPLLLFEKSRNLIIQTQVEHSYAFTHGWENGDSYDKNPLTWFPVLEKWYASGVFLVFLIGSLVVGCIRQTNRHINLLIATWIAPLSAYILVTFAVRPDHYWLPVMIPLFSCGLNLLPDELPENARVRVYSIYLVFIIGLFNLSQIGLNLTPINGLYQRSLVNDRLALACQPDSVNKPDGKSVILDSKTWYLVESIETQGTEKSVIYTVIQGPGEVSATSNGGRMAWKCISRIEAKFKGEFWANEYRSAHPKEKVSGPN